MEWGTALGISLGGDEPVILLRLSSEGNTARHECVIQGAPERGEVELRLPRPPSGPISLRHVLYPELGLERIELEVSGRLVARRVRALKAGVLSSRPELRLLGESLGRFYSARGVVRSITLEGLSIADEPDSRTPDASARQLVEGELLDALESMPSVEALEPGDRRLLWRSVALAELGRVDDATEALRRGASGDDASFEIRIVFQVQRNKSDLWQLAARRALGSRWVFFRYGDRNLDHSRRPGEVRETIAALSDVPLELDAAATPEQASGLAAALAIRGDAWFRNGQLERAVRDFDAAMPILERPDLRDTEHIRRTAARRRLELAVRRRDRQDTLIQLRRVLALSVAPMILIENSRVKPEYASLLRSADWDTLEAELSERSLLASPAASANASKQEE